MDMDPQELLLPGVVVATSVAAFIIGRRTLRLRPARLGRAFTRTLETLGLLVLFAVVNMALGVTFVLAWRALAHRRWHHHHHHWHGEPRWRDREEA